MFLSTGRHVVFLLSIVHVVPGGVRSSTTSPSKSAVHSCPLQMKCRYRHVLCSSRDQNEARSVVAGGRDPLCAGQPGLQAVSVTGQGYAGQDFAHLYREDFEGVRTPSLTLHGLGIETLEDRIFQGTEDILTRLDLGQNRLQTLGDAFRGLSQLISLDLSSNRLRKVPAGALRWLASLKNLNLFGNSIATIEPRDFRWVPGLLSLDISYNSMERISGQRFAGLPKLQHLDLHQTPLVCDCELAWLRQYASCLCVLGYSRCRAPESNRKDFSVSFPIANCTQEEKDLDFGCAKPLSCINNYTGFESHGFLETGLPSEDKDAAREGEVPWSAGQNELNDSEEATPSSGYWPRPSLESTASDQRHHRRHHRSWFMKHAAFVFPIIGIIMILFLILCFWAFLGRRCACSPLAFGMRMRESCESFITESSQVVYSNSHVALECE